MVGHLVIDRPRGGAENMAIDDRLLQWAAENDSVVFRWYRWAEPTLSLGYFQPVQDRAGHSTSQAIAAVRRSTGGGAIVHHFDWTYSVAMPAALLGPSVGAASAVYDAVHSEVVSWLRENGVEASQVRAEETCAPKDGKCAFLCFQRRSVGDVVADGFKLLGSAQRRRYGGLLQHGSLLLGESPHAPELPGIAEVKSNGRLTNLTGDNQVLDQLAWRIADKIGSIWGVSFDPLEGVEGLVSCSPPFAPFDESDWTERR